MLKSLCKWKKGAKVRSGVKCFYRANTCCDLPVLRRWGAVASSDAETRARRCSLTQPSHSAGTAYRFLKAAPLPPENPLFRQRRLARQTACIAGGAFPVEKLARIFLAVRATSEWANTRCGDWMTVEDDFTQIFKAFHLVVPEWPVCPGFVNSMPMERALIFVALPGGDSGMPCPSGFVHHSVAAAVTSINNGRSPWPQDLSAGQGPPRWTACRYSAAAEYLWLFRRAARRGWGRGGR